MEEMVEGLVPEEIPTEESLPLGDEEEQVAESEADDGTSLSLDEMAETSETVGTAETAPPTDGTAAEDVFDDTPDRQSYAALAEEATALQEVYPDFDLSQMMEDETFRALLSGEVRPTLRQVYEMLSPRVLVDTQVQAEVEARLSAAVETAVAEAVAMAEKNLLSHIRARGMRPHESGSNAASGVRTHPAVHRLTREDRAKLAVMAQRGENVRL